MQLFIFLAALLAAGPVMADEASTITLPIGEWVSPVLDLVGQVIALLLGTAAAWLLAKLPEPIATFLKQKQVDAVLTNAIGAGIAQVKGAAKGKVLSMDVGSRVVASAAQYALDRAPKLVETLGGVEAVKRMIHARLDLDADAALK